jgi:hypothetical protein
MVGYPGEPEEWGTAFFRARAIALWGRPAPLQRAGRPHPFLNRVFRADVLGPDPLEPFRSHLPVPNPVRIHRQPGAPSANPKTGRLGAHDFQPALPDPVLDPFPEPFSLLNRAAFGPNAQKQMAAGLSHASLFQTAEDFLGVHCGILSGSGGGAQPVKRPKTLKSCFPISASLRFNST